MKTPLRKITSLILLGFYLTGFCGIHFVKHSCTSCKHSEIHFNVDISCANHSTSCDDDCACCCCDHSHKKMNHVSNEDCHNSLCCNYDFVYLKTNPYTTINESSKAPLAIETILLFTNTLNTANKSISSLPKFGFFDDSPDDFIIADRSILCSYLC